MFLDNTACNLASVNLRKYFNESDNSFDVAGFEHTTRIWTIVLEISVLMAQSKKGEFGFIGAKGQPFERSLLDSAQRGFDEATGGVLQVDGAFTPTTLNQSGGTLQGGGTAGGGVSIRSTPSRSCRGSTVPPAACFEMVPVGESG
jgi:hypothetical protein